jgi:HUS1 checkpoint protein
MRFKAKLSNPQLLTKILQVHEKTADECLFKFSKKIMAFITKTEYQDGTQIWSRIKTNTLFTDFRIESTTDNDIYAKLDLKNISRALKTYSKAQSIVFKLSKKNSIAFLTLEIIVNSTNIVQDIPIQVLATDEVSQQIFN